MDIETKILSREVLVESKIFSVEKRMVILPGACGAEPIKASRDIVVHLGAAVILPLCDDGRLMMIRQYRFAVEKFLLEFPAGTLEPGEEIQSCARRELAEETGYQAEHWRSLGVVYPVPGYCCEEQHLFFASGLSPVQSEADPDEIISTQIVSVKEFEQAAQSGEIQDGKTLGAFFLARLQGLL